MESFWNSELTKTEALVEEAVDVTFIGATSLCTVLDAGLEVVFGAETASLIGGSAAEPGEFGADLGRAICLGNISQFSRLIMLGLFRRMTGLRIYQTSRILSDDRQSLQGSDGDEGRKNATHFV